MRDIILYSDNGTIEDLTTTLNDTEGSKALSWVAAEDAIYIGSEYAFTSKYLKSSVVNANSSDLTLEYWDGTEWRAAARLLDNTSSGGVPLSSSEYIEFSTDKSYPWVRRDTEDITDLTTLKIYDLFWVKITYSADITATLDWVGDLFCTDNDLRRISPSVMGVTLMDDWESGKTDWEEQRRLGTELLIQELQGYKLASPNMYLDKSELLLAAAYRTLAVIYDDMEDFEKVSKYMTRTEKLVRQTFSKDTNQNGKADRGESGLRVKRMVR